MVAPAVNTQVRDINIDLADSCNCRCFSLRRRKNQPMFVTKSGDAVPFNARLARDQTEAMQVTVTRLLDKLDVIADQAKCNREGLQKLVEAKIGRTLVVKPPSPITLDNVEVINAAIKDIFI